MGLQEPQSTRHRNLSWEKRWHDSEGPQLSLQHPVLSRGWSCRSCGETLHSQTATQSPRRTPKTGPGKHQSRPRGALCPDVSSQQVLVSAWLGQTLDVTKGREGSHQASSKTPAPALSTHPWPPGFSRRSLAQCCGTHVYCAQSGHLHGLQDRLVCCFV